jgi:hypothetical protein
LDLCRGVVRQEDALGIGSDRLAGRKVGWEQKAKFMIYEWCSLDCDRFRKNLEIM